jgi:hypothetical protein
MADEQLGDLEILNQDETTEETPEREETSEEETSEKTSDEEVTEEEKSEEEAETKEGEEEKSEEEPEPDEAEKLAQGRLTFKEVTTKFPTLFKEFPALRHAFFREQEYSKVFPTVEDAQEAATRAQNYAFLEQDLLAGEPKNLLTSVAQASPEAFERIVSRLLPTVYEVNKDAFYEMTEPIIKNALQAAYTDGSSAGTQDGKNLALAAQYIHRFLFRTADITNEKQTIREKQPDPERVKFEQERQQFQEARFIEFRSDIGKTAEAEVRKLIADGLDPEKKLNDFTRKTITKEIIEQIGSVLGKDPRHLATMESLWTRARKNGLTQEHKARILQTYLGRVKEVLPTIRSKVRSEALGIAKDKPVIKRPAGTVTGNATQTPGTINPRKVDWNKTSDLDFLNDNVKMKK